MIHTELKSKINEGICMMASPVNHPYSYLFDCGKASLLNISDVMRTKVVCVTHTHVDHFVNFDAILRNRAGSRDPLIICGPKGIQRNVQGKLHAYTWNLIGRNGSYFEVREILDPETYKVYRLSPPHWKLRPVGIQRGSKIFEHDQIFINYCILDHKIPSIAYRLCEENHLNIGKFDYKPGPWIESLKQAYRQKRGEMEIQIDGKTMPASDLFSLLKERNGYKVGYAMDHLGGGENHRLLKDFFYEIDELYIESFFRQVDWDYARRHHHSTAYLSGKLAREARVKTLHLVHHSRRYLGELRDLLEEGRAAYEGREPKFQKPVVSRYDESSEVKDQTIH